MENLFIKYMSGRLATSVSPKEEHLGPVITISRQYGCPGDRICAKLAQSLSVTFKENEQPEEWKWISKEILEESAKELKLTPTSINDLQEYKLHGFMDHLTLFFSTGFYPSDTKVMSTIAKVIHSAASHGHVVILGRAGEAITQNIHKSLHFKLEAPLDWRAEQVAKQKGLSISVAKELCINEDKLRLQFRDYFENGKSDIEFFDAMFNTKTMSDEEIVSLIIKLAKSKKLV